MIHELKTHPEPFEAIRDGRKFHEVRVNDRNYSIGDELLLREWNPGTEEYTGRQLQRIVSYITEGGTWGLPENLCVLSLHPDSYSAEFTEDFELPDLLQPTEAYSMENFKDDFEEAELQMPAGMTPDKIPVEFLLEEGVARPVGGLVFGCEKDGRYVMCIVPNDYGEEKLPDSLI
jgi:hypothetical protein